MLFATADIHLELDDNIVKLSKNNEFSNDVGLFTISKQVSNSGEKIPIDALSHVSQNAARVHEIARRIPRNPGMC